MRVNYLQLSNILSFKYEEDINNAFKIEFNPDLNIIIGENGSGKSTVLETMNFVFTRALFKRITSRYNDNPSYVTHSKQATVEVDDSYSNRTLGLRLQPNWNSEKEQQNVRISITLDDIDRDNIDHIVNNHSRIEKILNSYSTIKIPKFSALDRDVNVDINIIFQHTKYEAGATYEIIYANSVPEHVQFYLEYYHAINEAIDIHNQENTDDIIEPLGSTFSMLSAFRDYSNFDSQTSLYTGSDPLDNTLKNAKNRLVPSSINERPSGEPAIFNFIKLKLGEKHLRLIQEGKNIDDATVAINSLPLITNINERLKLLNLKLSIKPTNIRTWSYEFRFRDIKNDRELGDINSLSAGQKSIIHLIFEAYGRDDVNGGLIIIDEPEIHLHYQFQSKYLKILKDLAKEQKIQCILVTHSEGFISDDTIKYIKRFSLNEERNSVVHTPEIAEDQKGLIKILNNTQAARVLFLDKVLLIEGQDDEYFFRDAVKRLQPELSQDISIYETRGKDSIPSFKSFFESFGLKVYVIKDLDATGKDFYNSTVSFRNTGEARIIKYRRDHPDLDQQIESRYSSDEFYLKKGAIEQYTGKEKGIDHVIDFCENNMDNFLDSDDDKAKEIRKIIDLIADKDGDSTH
ncbi:hypothetical protein FBF29_01505 [Candidatus Saccharibacteria bacterium oral taxon 488]|nr:hypothetical protein FBF29_01505 [Candidatus Saccharibacteria bacterium oral taxon 488]